ncbi:MAG: flagellar hook-associated protein FlgK, partial [Myxococcota bacterium]|nr:flagellar hook-associated protein FlgK [Myxococcota bacterium]
NTAEHREAVHAQIENLFQSQSGVSLDEEMVQLTKYQRAFEAASKVLTTVDGLLEDLLRAL